MQVAGQSITVLDSVGNRMQVRVPEPPFEPEKQVFPDIFVLEEVFVLERYSSGMCRVMPSDEVVVDIGAHFGFFSLYAAQWEAKQIYAFEPEDRNYECLVRNKPANCRAFHAAVGARTERGQIRVADGAAMHRLSRESLNGNGQDVICLGINDLFGRLFGHIDFLKVDIEGGEQELFESITDDNLQRIKRGAVEWHSDVNPNIDWFVKRLESWFKVDVLKFGVGDLSYVYFVRK